MRTKDKIFIKKYPKIMSFLLNCRNHIVGGNKIKITSKNSAEIGIVSIKKTSILVSGINNTIVVGNLSTLKNCFIRVSGNNNHVVLGEETVLKQVTILIEGNHNTLSMGEHTSVEKNTVFEVMEGTSINIGNDCMISTNIIFRTGDSHSVTNLTGERINKSENIVIGNHVWIGARVICLKGVVIANNCIIGAGSIITKKISEENVVLAGNPARLVKRGVNWLREKNKRQKQSKPVSVFCFC